MPYTPILGGSGSASFPRQFEDSNVDAVSMAVTVIEHLANDGSNSVLGHGTGFFWQSEGAHYLVSARHVLSGLDPFTNDLMSGDGYIPERVRIFPTFQDEKSWVRSDGMIVDLTSNGQRRWLQDPEFETLRTDIAAIELDLTIPDGKSLVCLDRLVDNERLVTQVGFDCTIVGYPSRNLSDLRTPVWRRGALASEPFLPVDGKPMFLVDGSTSPGFSGSPVLRRHIGPAPVHDGSGGIVTKVGRVVTTILIGVYAGRLKHQFVGGEVPFAFYANRIPSIVKKPELNFTVGSQFETSFSLPAWPTPPQG